MNCHSVWNAMSHKVLEKRMRRSRTLFEAGAASAIHLVLRAVAFILLSQKPATPSGLF